MLHQENIFKVDFLILGAGAIGLQMGSLLEREGRDYLILEESVRPEDLFQENGTNMMRAGDCDIAWTELRIRYNAHAFHIDRRSGYEIIDQSGRVYRCKVLLIADGLSRGGHFNDTVFARSCWPARRTGRNYPAVTGRFESLNQPHMYFLCASAFYGNPRAISSRDRMTVFNFILDAPRSESDQIGATTSPAAVS